MGSHGTRGGSVGLGWTLLLFLGAPWIGCTMDDPPDAGGADAAPDGGDAAGADAAPDGGDAAGAECLRSGQGRCDGSVLLECVCGRPCHWVRTDCAESSDGPECFAFDDGVAFCGVCVEDESHCEGDVAVHLRCSRSPEGPVVETRTDCSEDPDRPVCFQHEGEARCGVECASPECGPYSGRACRGAEIWSCHYSMERHCTVWAEPAAEICSSPEACTNVGGFVWCGGDCVGIDECEPGAKRCSGSLRQECVTARCLEWHTRSDCADRGGTCVELPDGQPVCEYP